MQKESLEINPNSSNTVTTSNTNDNKVENSDIISANATPYFPQPYEAPLIGLVEDVYVETLDYMVGMIEFERVLQRLGVDSNNSVERNNNIYSVIDLSVVNKLRVLSNGDITKVGDFTIRVESPWSNTIGFDEYVLKHLQQYHASYIKDDVECNLLHRFIKLNYQKHNLIIHLYPYKVMKHKGVPYHEALSYCISIMWAAIISIVARVATEDDVVETLQEVFFRFNAILTKMVICSHRALTPEGYGFLQELKQLSSANKHLTIKTTGNHVNFRWSPRSGRFQDYIKDFAEHNIIDSDTEPTIDLRGDNSGKRACIYDCRIDKSSLITKITAVGQNILRDITGYYATTIYGLLCDIDQLKHFELACLFTFLTGTEEHNNLLEHLMMRIRTDIMTRKLKVVRVNNFSTGFTSTMLCIAEQELRDTAFQDLKPNNDLYIAEQLINRFNIRRNLAKEVITILKFAELPNEEFEEQLKLIERHKQASIRERVQFVLTLELPKDILNELYRYLLLEGFRL